ncbi:MAG: hypothetical protein KBA30_08425 [Clostridia bacterium]|nr:hypothetical protein [Clostridia bacterium]
MRTKQHLLRTSLLPVLCLCVFAASVLPAATALAGVTGSEGGGVIGIPFDIGAGGSIVLHLDTSSSPDLVLTGPTRTPVTVVGPATGSYPATGDASVVQGYVTLDRIDILPADGFRIGDLVVDGTSQGAVASYDFTGFPHTFSVTFTAIPAETTTAATSPTTVPTAAPTSPPTTTAAATAITTATAASAATTSSITAGTTPCSITTVATTTVATTTAAGVASPRPSTAPGTAGTTTAGPAASQPLSGGERVTASALPGPSPSGIPGWLIVLLILILLLLLISLFFFVWHKRKRKKKETAEAGDAAQDG